MTSTHLDTFRDRLSHPLDDFQVEGCRAVEEGHGVLVCAPTGAGKTIVGEFAVSLALSRGTRCFYTTPIKALSNQKYHDLVAAHGEDAVGLLTGDVSINSQAEILVMTTEVLRNMIYAESGALDRLSHVVMDEVHFLADASRGAVWEEVILNLDESVSIIGLSATVSNSEEFGEWLSAVRGDTTVIVSDHRPVPLDQWMMIGRKIYPLFEPESGGQVNAELARRIRRLEAGDSDDGRNDAHSGQGFRARARHKGGGRGGRGRSGASRPQDRYRPLGRPETLQVLQGMDMLPAITFIFSRAVAMARSTSVCAAAWCSPRKKNPSASRPSSTQVSRAFQKKTFRSLTSSDGAKHCPVALRPTTRECFLHSGTSSKTSSCKA